MGYDTRIGSAVPAPRARDTAARASRKTPPRCCTAPARSATTSRFSRASSRSNEAQYERMVDKVRAAVGGSLDRRRRRRVGPDLQSEHRRPPGLSRGHDHASARSTRARRSRRYDPAAGDKAAASSRTSMSWPTRTKLRAGADVVVLLTEWDDFRHYDFDRVRDVMRGPTSSTHATSSIRPRCAVSGSTTKVSAALRRAGAKATAEGKPWVGSSLLEVQVSWVHTCARHCSTAATRSSPSTTCRPAASRTCGRCLGRSGFELLTADVVDSLPVAGPVDGVFHLAEPREPAGIPGTSARDDGGRRGRHRAGIAAGT